MNSLIFKVKKDEWLILGSSETEPEKRTCEDREYYEDKRSLQGKQFREKNTDKGTDSNTNDQNASTEPTQKESLATVQNTFLRNKIR